MRIGLLVLMLAVAGCSKPKPLHPAVRAKMTEVRNELDRQIIQMEAEGRGRYDDPPPGPFPD